MTPDQHDTDSAYWSQWEHGAEWEKQASDPDYAPIKENKMTDHLHRSFPEAGDGRPMPPMGYDLMTAGLSADDARFVAVQLRQNGFYLVHPDRLGWPDIRRFESELARGQGIHEDGGGFFIRCIMSLFGKKPDPVETYQEAARRLLEGMNDD